jgi:hypothetical protein
MLCECFFLLIFLFPHENSKSIGANYLTKENRQSIIAVITVEQAMR